MEENKKINNKKLTDGVLLCAGYSTRMKPLILAKELLPVWDVDNKKFKNIIDKNLENLLSNFSRVFVVSRIDKDDLNNYIIKNYSNVKLVFQLEKIGTGGALYYTRDLLNDYFYFQFGDLYIDKNNFKNFVNSFYSVKEKIDVYSAIVKVNKDIAKRCAIVDTKNKKVFEKPHDKKVLEELVLNNNKYFIEVGAYIMNKRILFSKSV